MSQKTYILEHLHNWQNENHELVDTQSDVKVFNTIGLIMTLANGGLLDLINAHKLISEVLSLTDEEKETAYRVVADGYDYAEKMGLENEEV
jgi:hypothetical protein